MLRALCCLAVLSVVAATTCKPCTCGVTRGARILGGVPVVAGEFPWLAAVHRDGNYVCGATVVARDHLVTAAHCVSNYEASRFHVMVGVHNISDPTAKRFGVQTVYQHPGFNTYNYDNDIAVLRLTESLPDNLFRPACLPDDNDNRLFVSEEAIVSGWGATEERGFPVDTPNKVAVKIWEHEDCKNAGYGRRKVTPRMICANELDADACTGDSGGPLLITKPYNTVVGVVSWGRGCGRAGYPGVYTRVTKLLPWLRKALRHACPCSAPSQI